MDKENPNFDQLASLIGMQEQLQKQFHDNFREVLNRLSLIESRVAQATKSEAIASPCPTMDWESQKKALYAEHAISGPISRNDIEEACIPEVNTPDDGPPRPFAPANERYVASQTSPAKNLASEKKTLESKTSQQITELETELHEKLRMAELELSIGRAKIIQETALLEEQRRELEALMRVVDPLSKNATNEKKPSIRDRLSRHLKSVRRAD